MQIPTGRELLGEFQNYKIEIDWDEFNDGVTLKERLWSTHQSLIDFLDIVSNVLFWSKLLFNLINGESIFSVNIDSFVDILFLFALCWLTAKVISRYYKHEFPKTQNILINKYILPSLQKELIDSFQLPRKEDNEYFFRYLSNQPQIQKLQRINNISSNIIKDSVDEFIDEYRTRNWIAILLFESSKLMFAKKNNYIGLADVLQAILEKNSDRQNLS
jgi:hypothetical protein